jgi:hypothetical protein
VCWVTNSFKYRHSLNKMSGFDVTLQKIVTQ